MSTELDHFHESFDLKILTEYLEPCQTSKIEPFEKIIKG